MEACAIGRWWRVCVNKTKSAEMLNRHREMMRKLSSDSSQWCHTQNNAHWRRPVWTGYATWPTRWFWAAAGEIASNPLYLDGWQNSISLCPRYDDAINCRHLQRNIRCGYAWKPHIQRHWCRYWSSCWVAVMASEWALLHRSYGT